MRARSTLTRWMSGLASPLFTRSRVEEDPCDVLFLYAWAGEAARTGALARALERRGLRVRHVPMLSPLRVLSGRMLAKPDPAGTLVDRFCNSASAYLVRRYRPRVLLTFDDGTSYTASLRREMRRTGGALVHIAHGVTGDSPLFTNFNFDYYFIFGRSSLEAITRQKSRHGSTKVVVAGSYLIDEDFSLPILRDSSSILFFSSWLHPSVRSLLLDNFRLLAGWARTQTRYELIVKHHPLEDESVIRRILAGIPRVRFLPRSTSLKDAVREVSLVMISWSVASIEASLLNRPAVIVNGSDNADFLEIERYFPPRAKTASEIQERIDRLTARYDEFLEQGRRFVRLHLARTTDSIPYIASCVDSIAHGREDFEVHPLKETVP